MVKRHVRFNPNKFRQQSDPKKTDIGAPPIPLIPSTYLSKSVFRARLTVLEEWTNTPPSMTDKTTEEWTTNLPPAMAKITTEEWANILIVMPLVVETFMNQAGAMNVITTENESGYLLAINHQTLQTGLTAAQASTVTVTVEQDINGVGNWQTVYTGPLGNITTILFYPGRGHRSNVSPTTIGGKTYSGGVQNWTPSYTSKTVLTFAYV